MFDAEELLGELAGKGETAALAIVVAAKGGGARPGAKAVYDSRGERRGGDAHLSEAAERRLSQEAKDAIVARSPRLVELHADACGADCTVYVEPRVFSPDLLVLGSGPVVEALVRVAAASGLRVHVLGPGATRERYPLAARADDDPRFARARSSLAGVHVVVATGHEADEEAILAALEGKPASVQLVASSRRAPRVLEALRKAGAAEEAVALVHAPAGLDIGGQGPAEIALSIAAEVVRRRRGGTGRPLALVKGSGQPLAAPKPGEGEPDAASGPRGTERYRDEEEDDGD